jgi:hypothetical protein
LDSKLTEERAGAEAASNMRILQWCVHAAFLAAMVGTGCGASQYHYQGTNYDGALKKGTVLNSVSLDPATEDAILALAPHHLSDGDVRNLLSLGPAPRIMNLDGSVPIVTMKPFSEFLIVMGYPEEKIRQPKGGSYSYSSFSDSRRLAGMLAWYYEREGMTPILIGHSKGGMLVIKVLHELAGAFHHNIPVWNPLTNEAEKRVTIIDPITGEARSVIGLRVRYAAAITTGKLMRILFGEWSMFPRLREIPDTVEEFTGFSLT